jgi:hypothetical protein
MENKFLPLFSRFDFGSFFITKKKKKGGKYFIVNN